MAENFLRRSARSILNQVLIPFSQVIARRAHPARLPNGVQNLLLERAIASSADYVEAHMLSAVPFDEREYLWDYAIKRVSIAGLAAEFGVFQGESINYFATRFPVVYGFDSFEGLQEDWSGKLPKGAFTLGGKLPRVAANVQLIKGWFDETLPGFLMQHPEPFAFVHVDCDTYEATQILLQQIGSRIVSGTILVFDEYFGYTNWQNGEYKAWQEYVARTGTAYEYLGFSDAQVAVRIR